MYYPKSKIQENQYTKGGEFIRKDNKQLYTGYYCIISDGKFFSGKTVTNTSIELLKIEKNARNAPFRTPSVENIASKISTLVNLRNQRELKPSIVKPNDEDYKRGFMIRFFAKKLQSKPPQIIEISEEDYIHVFNKSNKYYNVYQVMALDWKITGPDHDIVTNPNLPIYGIIDTNKRTLEKKEREMNGITLYIGNKLKEFAK